MKHLPNQVSLIASQKGQEPYSIIKKYIIDVLTYLNMLSYIHENLLETLYNLLMNK